MHNLNVLVFYFLNGAAEVYGPLDAVMLFVTTYATLVVGLAVTLWMVVWLPLKARSVGAELRAIRHALEYLFVVGGVYVLVSAVKVVTHIPRPFLALGDVRSLSPLEAGYSFPSMHAALMVGIATLVYLHHKRTGKLLAIFAVAVSISRVFIGVHYPKDVFVGGMLGFAISALLHIAFCNMHSDIVNDVAGAGKTR